MRGWYVQREVMPTRRLRASGTDAVPALGDGRLASGHLDRQLPLGRDDEARGSVRVGMAARSGEAPVAEEDRRVEGADAGRGDAGDELVARFPETALAFEVRLRDRWR